MNNQNQLPINVAQSVSVLKSVAETAIYKGVIMRNQANRKPLSNNEYEGKIETPPAKDSELYKSPLGTPVVANIKFCPNESPVKYTDTVTGLVKTVPEQIYETVLITVNQAKKIIKTEIQGRDGTVKEYIGLDDYQVSINGIIVGANGVYPKEQVQKLKALLDAPVSLPVVCTYLNDLGIYNLVVEDYTLDQEPGGYSKQNFSINCISDIPIELQIQ